MRAIELFAGAGGLALGVTRAGFSHEAIVEWNRDACETIRENKRRGYVEVADWPEPYEGDVRAFDFRSLGALDLVAGGPPCQPFSLGGRHQAHLDPRDMWPQAARAVLETSPRAFLFENVRGLTRASFAAYFEYIRLRLSFPELLPRGEEPWAAHHARLLRHRDNSKRVRGLEYDVRFALMNAANYGVPQKRERVFVVGFRSDLGLSWSFPEPTHSRDVLLHSQWVTGEYWERHRVAPKKRPKKPASTQALLEMLDHRESWRTVRDAIADLPEPQTNGKSNGVLNHRFQAGARPYPGHTGSPVDEPSKTLKAGVHGVPGGENTVVFPDGTMRYLTAREAARVQTFPDDYVLTGAWSECMRQIGNAVAVDLGRILAERVAAVLKHAACSGAQDQVSGEEGPSR